MKTFELSTFIKRFISLMFLLILAYPLLSSTGYPATYNASQFFTALIYNGATQDHGTAIFNVTNPVPASIAVNKNILNFILHSNNTPTDSVKIEWYNYTVVDNETRGFQDFPNSLSFLPGQTHTFRVYANWTVNPSGVTREWVPYITYGGNTLYMTEWATWSFNQIFKDDFEAGNMNNWVITAPGTGIGWRANATFPLNGTYSAKWDTKQGSGTTFMNRTQDLTGWYNISVCFQADVNALDAGENLTFYYKNTSGWNKIWTVNDIAQTSYCLSIVDATIRNKPGFNMSFSCTQDAGTNERCWVDDVIIQGTKYGQLLVTNLSISPVNASSQIISQDSLFNVTATVMCDNGNCGETNATLYYNWTGLGTTTPVNTTDGNKPFYNFSGANPFNCPATFGANYTNCTATWSVNATGAANTQYWLNVTFKSEISSVVQNDTGRFQINITTTADTTPPNIRLWTYNVTNETNYSSAQGYQFNATVTDLTGISYVWVEQNFTGTLTNTTVGSCGGDIYCYNVSPLSAGFYYIKWYANDSSANKNLNNSDWIHYYQVNKSWIPISLYINGTAGTKTLRAEGTANFTANFSTAYTFSITLWTNLSGGEALWDTQNSPLMNYTDLTPYDGGHFMIKANWSGNTNYTISEVNHTLILTHVIKPAMSTFVYNVSNMSNYSPTQGYQFNATVNDTAGLTWVKIEHNFTGVLTNYTVSTVSGSVYYYDYQPLGAGFYQFKWYANDTVDNINESSVFYYQVNKSYLPITLYINSTDGDVTVYNNTDANFTANFSSSYAFTIEIWTNLTGTMTQEGSSASPYTLIKTLNQYKAQNYTVEANWTGNQNYTYSDTNHSLTLELKHLLAPAMSNFVYNVSNLSYYSPLQGYQFNATVNDTAGLTWVWIEHNFSGTLLNYSVSGNLRPSNYGIIFGTVYEPESAYDLKLNDTTTNATTFGGSSIVFNYTNEPKEGILFYTWNSSSAVSGAFNISLLNYTSNAYQTLEFKLDPTVTATFTNKTSVSKFNGYISTDGNISLKVQMSGAPAPTIRIFDTYFQVEPSNPYQYDYPPLSAGLYRFSWFANDTQGNINNSAIFYYQINQSYIPMSLYINGTDGDIELYNNSDANFTTNFSSSYSFPITLYTNLSGSMTLWDTQNSPLMNYTVLEPYIAQNGYLIIANWSGNENYTSSQANHTLNLTFLAQIINVTTIELNYPNDNEFNASSNISFGWTPVFYGGSPVNCSLYTNDTGSWDVSVLNQTEVLNNTPNSIWFNVTGLNITWGISCYGGDLLNFSSNRTLNINNVTIPQINVTAISLNYPDNNVFNVSSNISFGFTPIFYGGNPTNCSLWTNNSGSWDLTAENQTETLNNSLNSIWFNVTGLNITWGIGCYAEGLLNFSENRTLNVNNVSDLSPILSGFKWNVSSDNSSGALSMANYSRYQGYQFNITVADESLDTVWIEANFTGVMTNTTVTTKNGDEYYYNAGVLAAVSGGYVPIDGYYYVKWWANDTTGKIENSSVKMYYVRVQGTNPVMFVNGTVYEYVATYLDPVDFFNETDLNVTVMCNATYDREWVPYIEITYSSNLTSFTQYVNGSRLDNITSLNAFAEGIYYLYATCNYVFSWDNTNYSGSTYAIYINVTRNDAPNLAALKYNVTNTSSYLPSRGYGFNITVIDDSTLDKVWIETNFTGTLQNYTVTTHNGNEYYYNAGVLGASWNMSMSNGGYNYYAKWWANDTKNNVNSSAILWYRVNQQTTNVSVLINNTMTYNGERAFYNDTDMNVTIRCIGAIDGSDVYTSIVYSGNFSFPNYFYTNGTRYENISSLSKYQASTYYVSGYCGESSIPENPWKNVNYSYTGNAGIIIYLLKDTTPNIADFKANQTNSSQYNSTMGWQFNVTINSDALDDVWIEHNFSGTLQNYTVTTHNGSEYYYDAGVLGASTLQSNGNSYDYYIKWYANDTSNKTNSSNIIWWRVAPADSQARIYINGTDYSEPPVTTINLTTGQFLNVTGKCYGKTDGVFYFGEIRIQNNFSGYFVNITWGTYNENISYPTTGYYYTQTDCQYVDATNKQYNYSSSSAYVYVNVTEIPASTPVITNIKTSPASGLNYTTTYQFNATVTNTDGLSAVYIENNFGGSLTNTTVSSHNGDEYYISFSIGAGSYQYKWWALGTTGVNTSSGPYSYVIYKADLPMTLYINGVNGDKSLYNNTGSIINMTATLGKSYNITLYTNFSGSLDLWDFGDSPFTNLTAASALIAGNYSILANWSGNANYSSNSSNHTLTISEYVAPPAATCVIKIPSDIEYRTYFDFSIITNTISNVVGYEITDDNDDVISLSSGNTGTLKHDFREYAPAEGDYTLTATCNSETTYVNFNAAKPQTITAMLIAEGGNIKDQSDWVKVLTILIMILIIAAIHRRMRNRLLLLAMIGISIYICFVMII